MKPVHLVLTIAFAIVALSLTAWLGKPKDKISVVESPVKASAPADKDALPIPEKGPYGKAVAVESMFDFGAMERGQKSSHTFIVKNEGQGPLRVKKGATSCHQCTFGTVSPEDEDIPPGGTAAVTVNWEIKSTAPKFRQTAEIHTNDPENRKLVFAVSGNVDNPLHLIPAGTWSLGDLADNEPTTAEGLLYSTIVDDVTIDRVECPNPLVTVTWEPAKPEDLADKHGKAGARIKVSIAPGLTIGPLRETVIIHTKVRGDMTMDLSLAARRPGPVEVKGRGFTAENNVVKLGEFPADKGAKTSLKMYIRNLEGDLQADQIDVENSRAKVRISPTGKTFGKARMFDVEVEVPPGPPVIRIEKNAEPVVLKLNHPMAEEFKMYVDYHAQ